MKPVYKIKFHFVAYIVIGIIFSFSAPGRLAWAQPADTWPALDYSLVVQGLNRPVHVASAGDGSNRLFIVEQIGRVRIYAGGLQSVAFLDIRDKVSAPGSGGGSEEGLLSIAFPPDFALKRYFYVYYTNKAHDNQVSRFHLTPDPNLADPNSEELILYLNHPNFSNHNGGQLAFGQDGYLYIGTGDGGGAGDPAGNAQNPASLLGKLLRIDVEIQPAQPPPTDIKTYLAIIFRCSPGSAVPNYRIPGDNPFVGVSGYREEIWALGLRNPWRFSFDGEDGDLYIADVGQFEVEEVDYQNASSPGGENYGWNIMEGDECYNSPTCNQAGLTLPVFTYTHAAGHCSVTGGHVYRGAAKPGMVGIYFLADFCSGVIWGLRQEGGAWVGSQLLDTPFNIASFGLDEDGELYFTDLFGGSVYMLIEDNP